ncbi:FecR family protein [Pseudomonas sp. R76]|uniref:FecR family protein n=1 Tax=Pseudomonas sp. R76 TaxID=1573711 RepID=UPI00131F6B52|nr:FecR family protein [Pseudomonas sp. R76]QHD09186.1 siderophore-interacting protein [Pseudomonas sp. R76]
MNSQGPQQHSITEAAAEWTVRLHAGALTEQEQAELRHWIACDSRHEAALRFAEQTWAALGELHKDEPVHRQRPSSAPLPVRRPKRRRLWQRVAAVAVVVLVAGVGWVRGPDALLRLQADYVTQKGEVRTVHLADGSAVVLDSASAIRLDYDGVQRRISLIQGSAIFDVAPMTGQETRPFVVQSAAGQTRALGTRFVVEREGASQAWVGVLQHSVEVSLQTAPKNGPSESVLKEGQVARYSPRDGVVALDRFDVERATSWRRGVLIFDRLPLAKVIEQLNRYRPGHVVLTNPALGDREVSGVFRLDMLDTALGTLTQELQVQRLDLAGLSLIY